MAVVVQPFGTGWRWLLVSDDGELLHAGQHAYSSEGAAEHAGERQLQAMDVSPLDGPRHPFIGLISGNEL